MSWSSYVDSMLATSPAIQRAAIVGYPDGSIWARTEGERLFQATEDELKTFAPLFQDTESVPAKGADLEGVHYVVPRAEETIIFGKKDKSGFFAAKTGKAVLIAMYEGENAAGSEVRAAVEKLAKYMNDLGY